MQDKDKTYPESAKRDEKEILEKIRRYEAVYAGPQMMMTYEGPQMQLVYAGPQQMEQFADNNNMNKGMAKGFDMNAMECVYAGPEQMQEIVQNNSRYSGEEYEGDYEPKFCPTCGARLAKGQKFCAECGSRIERNA